MYSVEICTSLEALFRLVNNLNVQLKYSGFRNDIWKFSNESWVPVVGQGYQIIGNYVDKRIASIRSYPGARRDAITWLDKNNNLWMYGGISYQGTIYNHSNL